MDEKKIGQQGKNVYYVSSSKIYKNVAVVPIFIQKQVLTKITKLPEDLSVY